MDSVGQRLDLMELGTRFDHYLELKEVFMLGIEVINGMRPAFLSDADKTTRVKLTAAVEVINKRLDYLSDFSDKTSNWSSIAKQVNDAGIHRTLMLTEGTKDAQSKPQDTNQPSRSENPST